MTVTEMFGQSGVLTLLGIAVVFSFLLILIVCVSIMGRVIQKLSPRGSNTQVAVVSPGLQITAAISAAVNEYLNNES